MFKNIFKLFFLFVFFLNLFSCAEDISLPSSTLLVEAIEKSPRTEWGFLPLPEKFASLTNKIFRDKNHIVMIVQNVPFSTFYFVFKLTDDAYILIEEQDTYYGTVEYNTVDGALSESIILTYTTDETIKALINIRNKLQMIYNPTSSFLNTDLNIEKVRQIVKKWNQDWKNQSKTYIP